MKTYLFHNKELGLSEEGIHLLRNGFNYETIAYSDINHVEILKGNALKNRMILLIAGLGLIGFGIYLILGIVDVFGPESQVRTVYIEGLLLPILPFLIGSYCLYAALKKETILIISGKKKAKCSLATFEKSDQLNEIQKLLKSKTTLRV
jgi:hypothetical protein